MIPGTSDRAELPHVIVVGNEKGGSGKSTVAIHVAVALLKSGASVATVDLDSRQGTLAGYIENRQRWAERIGRELAIPKHVSLDLTFDGSEDHATRFKALVEAVAELAEECNYVVIDMPGHDSIPLRLVHSMADTLITPLNDSFVDFDVLADVDPETYAIGDTSHYGNIVEEARFHRQQLDKADIDWIVLRNRLSTFGSSRNKRLVGEALEQLSKKLSFRFVDGLAERVIFREFYPRGLTAVDDVDELTLGKRPTMSHVTAKLEMENLLRAILLGNAVQGESAADSSRTAA